MLMESPDVFVMVGTLTIENSNLIMYLYWNVLD